MCKYSYRRAVCLAYLSKYMQCQTYKLHNTFHYRCSRPCCDRIVLCGCKGQIFLRPQPRDFSVYWSSCSDSVDYVQEFREIANGHSLAGRPWRLLRSGRRVVWIALVGLSRNIGVQCHSLAARPWTGHLRSEVDEYINGSPTEDPL